MFESKSNRLFFGRSCVMVTRLHFNLTTPIFMKTKFSNKELVHVWANQTQSRGSGSNMFFEDSKIYSYGKHFCIANFVKPNVVLLNSNSYSNSTAKQQSLVYFAVRNHKTFSVPHVGYLNTNHDLNIEFFKKEVIKNIEAAKKSNRYSARYLSGARSVNELGLDYCSEFDLEAQKEWFLNPIEISIELQARIEKQAEKQRIANELIDSIAKREESILRNDLLPIWINNGTGSVDVNGKKYNSSSINRLNESYLRLSGDKVETSHGAKVSLKSSRMLFDMIKKGMDIKGHKIDDYMVISLNGVLTIGCHKIDRSEINRFAKTQNWGQIAIH